MQPKLAFAAAVAAIFLSAAHASNEDATKEAQITYHGHVAAMDDKSQHSTAPIVKVSNFHSHLYNHDQNASGSGGANVKRKCFIEITNPGTGKKVKAKIVGVCSDCTGDHDIKLSKTAFGDLFDAEGADEGKKEIEWKFLGCETVNKRHRKDRAHYSDADKVAKRIQKIRDRVVKEITEALNEIHELVKGTKHRRVGKKARARSGSVGSAVSGSMDDGESSFGKLVKHLRKMPLKDRQEISGAFKKHMNDFSTKPE